MSNETELIGEADCVLCRGLDPDQRAAMRADLLEIPFASPSAINAWSVRPLRGGRSISGSDARS
jgi:hypothetical protein